MKPFGGVARQFRLGLVAGRPAAAGIAADRAAHRAERLVERNAERLRLHVPDRDVDAGNRFHDDAAAPAFIGLCHAALERRRAARAVIHLLVDALGEHRVLADDFRRELVLDDGRDDRRRAERRADAGEPVVGLDANERRVALDLRSEIGAVLSCGGHRSRHRDGTYTRNLHQRSPPALHLSQQQTQILPARSEQVVFRQAIRGIARDDIDTVQPGSHAGQYS